MRSEVLRGVNDNNLLGCDAMYFGRQVPTFKRNLSAEVYGVSHPEL
jgi:hypothetical protein